MPVGVAASGVVGRGREDGRHGRAGEAEHGVVGDGDDDTQCSPPRADTDADADADQDTLEWVTARGRVLVRYR